VSNKFHPLSSLELHSLAQKLSIPNFAVVSHNDLIRKKNKFADQSMIINLDRDPNGQGTHWTCLFVSHKLPYNIYFDSFGVSPSDIIIKYLKQNGKLVKFNNSEIQHMKSIMCGYYCIYVLDKLNKGHNIYDILMKFEQDPDLFNEKLIQKYGSNLLVS
jgi:hypothetical protein